MPFDLGRNHDDPGLDATRLAYGGTINVPDERYSDRLLAWFYRFLYALLAVGILAVVYGYFAITP
jgi:hypothetical protein